MTGVQTCALPIFDQEVLVLDLALGRHGEGTVGHGQHPVGAADAPYRATAPVSEVPKTATYTHAYAESGGFLTLLSDGQRLTGAYALGPEAGEWMQQATLAIRAHVPLEVLSDTIQPFPSFSGIYDAAVTALRMQVADMPPPMTPMDAQMAGLQG